MERLMNHFLTIAAARDTFKGDHFDQQPIDLSWTTRHTCHQFVDEEDLRHNSDDDVIQSNPVIKQEATALWPDSVIRRSLSVKTEPTSPQGSATKQEVTTPKRPHPFSIAALIGDHIDDHQCSSRSMPAKITSLSFPQYTSTPYKPLGDQQHCDQLSTISPIRSSNVTGEAYWCHACNAMCLDHQDAAQHQLVHRLRGTRCSLKTAAFSLYGYVTCHKKIADDRLQCGVCEKVVSSCFFTKHQRLHDGHFCDVCGQEFSTNSRLQDHMNIHTGSMPFTCRICDRKFAKRASYTQHMRYHRDHKSYPCSYCQKSFNTKYACAVHERLHTGDNPFRCEVPGCKRSFPQKIQLQLHVASHNL